MILDQMGLCEIHPPVLFMQLAERERTGPLCQGMISAVNLLQPGNGPVTAHVRVVSIKEVKSLVKQMWQGHFQDLLSQAIAPGLWCNLLENCLDSCMSTTSAELVYYPVLLSSACYLPSVTSNRPPCANLNSHLLLLPPLDPFLTRPLESDATREVFHKFSLSFPSASQGEHIINCRKTRVQWMHTCVILLMHVLVNKNKMQLCNSNLACFCVQCLSTCSHSAEFIR